MKLGLDLSIQKELNQYKPIYKYEGKEIEPFSFFSNHSSISSIRLRLWMNPYDEKGNPYGGGTNDLDTFLYLAKKANANGMSVLLDFHYSDFWVDPSRQLSPKAWRNKTISEVVELLYKYTKDTLLIAKQNNIDISAIQIGNEITHGIAWPYGDVEQIYNESTGGGFKGLGMLLKAGCKAAKEIYPNAKRIIHLEHSGSFDMQDWFFSNLEKEGVEFEVIGESYYPYWHGPFPMFKDCVSRLKEKYQKEIWVVEIGYQYVPYPKDHDFSEVRDQKEGDFIPGNINGRIPFAPTKQGQADYFAHMLEICKEIGVGMVYYWEPTWIGDMLPWASDAGQRYCGFEPVEAGNVWKIETFFDEKGDANPIVDIFTQKFVDSIK